MCQIFPIFSLLLWEREDKQHPKLQRPALACPFWQRPLAARSSVPDTEVRPTDKTAISYRDWGQRRRPTRTVADRWGTPPSAELLTGTVVSFGFAGMSRVKQKETLNRLLFLSAVTRKGFGERRMSPRWINAKWFNDVLMRLAARLASLLSFKTH